MLLLRETLSSLVIRQKCSSLSWPFTSDPQFEHVSLYGDKFAWSAGREDFDWIRLVTTDKTFDGASFADVGSPDESGIWRRFEVTDDSLWFLDTDWLDLNPSDWLLRFCVEWGSLTARKLLSELPLPSLFSSSASSSIVSGIPSSSTKILIFKKYLFISYSILRKTKDLLSKKRKLFF